MNSQAKSALIIVMSPITRDPRVRRQIEWLSQVGYVIDTIGPGDHHVSGVRDHFALGAHAPWTRNPLASALIYGVLPRRKKFALLTSDRIPLEVRQRVSTGSYGLVLFNDHHFMPWVADNAVFTSSALQGHIHLDLHEYVPPRSRRDSLFRKVAAPYYEWVRTFIGDPRFDTRSTVVDGISALYAEEFGFPLPAVVRNCPPFVEQSPRQVDPEHIRLLYHGAANPHRGIFEVIDAMRSIEKRFSLTLMLVGGDSWINTFKQHARGLEGRVHFVPPVPMPEISAAANAFDLEVMFYPPRNKNLEFALPNKFFEAIQGRLGLVIGESPMMSQIVRRYDNGEVIQGWTPADLAAGINALTPERVAEMKAASDIAARELSSESERSVFLESAGIASS